MTEDRETPERWTGRKRVVGLILDEVAEDGGDEDMEDGVRAAVWSRNQFWCNV